MSWTYSASSVGGSCYLAVLAGGWAIWVVLPNFKLDSWTNGEFFFFFFCSEKAPRLERGGSEICSSDLMGASCFIPLRIQFSSDFNDIWSEQRQEVHPRPLEQGRCPVCSSPLGQVPYRFPLSVSQSAAFSRADEHQHSRKILGCAHSSLQRRGRD